MRFSLLVFMAVTFLHFEVSQQCSKNLCFTWSVTPDKLTLKCTTHVLLHSVFIFDQFGHLQADCLPPFPYVHCEQAVLNGTITQNIDTNETVYTVTGNIDTHLNGNWTCRHGLFQDVAHVQVTVFKVKENTKDKSRHVQVKDTTLFIFQGHECMLVSLFWSFVSVFLAVMAVMVASTFEIFKKCPIRRRCNQNENVYRIKTVSICFCMLLFFGIIAVVTSYSDKTCKSIVVFPVIGSLFAVILAYCCLDRRYSTFQARNEEEMEPTNYEVDEIFP